LAKEQHKKYCTILKKLGLKLIRIKADDRFPDCCFVEDTAIIIDDKAIISQIGTKTRRGEELEVKKVLENYKKVYEIKPPAKIEGGDVLKIDKKIYVGLSSRTNQFAIQQLSTILYGDGYEIIPVKINNNIFHLKSACTYIGNGYIILALGYFDDKIFSEYNRIIINKKDKYSANCLAINGKVIIPKGYPKTKMLIEKEGFETIEIDMSEFKKGDGSLTCLSILF